MVCGRGIVFYGRANNKMDLLHNKKEIVMTQYIDKAALVAEIKRRRKLVSDPILSGNDLMIGERNAYFNLLSFLDTLEVKEVDLDFEQELYKAFGQVKDFTIGMRIARHFYELGLNVKKGE